MNEKYMKVALKEAEKCLKTGDIPVGAVLVSNKKILSKSHNQRELKNMITKHSELIVIDRVCKKRKNWHLDDCTLYVTMEPCMMCSGAIIQARIKKVIYALDNPKYGCADILIKNGINIEKGIYEQQSEKILKKFFKQKRS